VTIEAAAVDKREIQQLLVVVEADAKPQVLVRALQQYPHESALVFANLKSSVAELAQTLQSAGMSAAALHGDLEQFDRDRVMAKFRNASSRVLVATDVAARGIDVASLDLVVNYDLPAQPEVYVHRIGRTGRAGKTGVAISLATARDKPRIAAIEQATGVQLERTKLSGERKARESAPVANMDTLQISGGRKHKVRPADILGALTGEAGGLAGTDIGKIEIHDNFSYVAVAKRVSQRAQQSLNNGRIKGSKFRVTLVK
jgi:ATP-independent RNA helicase DbpA